MNKIIDFIKQVFQGKTIARILLNWKVYEHCRNLNGFCLDLASGYQPSYYRYWSFDQGARLIKTDYNQEKKPDIKIDLNHSLPLENNSVDNIFLFNAVHVVDQPKYLIKEIKRILKPNGKFFMYSHLISIEVPEPYDYRRLTSGGIKRLLKSFNQVEIHKVGERGTASVHLRHDFYRFRLIKLFAFSFGLLLDALTPKKIKNMHPGPIGYFVIASK